MDAAGNAYVTGPLLSAQYPFTVKPPGSYSGYLTKLDAAGANLGPAVGVAAPDGSDPSIAGVSITFDGRQAPLLYVSARQINVAVSVAMRVTVNGASAERDSPYGIQPESVRRPFGERGFLPGRHGQCQPATYSAKPHPSVAAPQRRSTLSRDRRERSGLQLCHPRSHP